jgi:hypothetical protein
MLRKKILLLLFLLLVLALASCNTDKYGLGNESTNEPQNAIEKDIQIASAGKAGENNISSKSTDQVSNSEVYEITQSSYTDKGMKIAYPQIVGLSDTNRQKEINDLIKKEALKILDYYNIGEEVSLDINYDIKWKGTNLLSIKYFGVSNIKGAAYPENMFYTTNVDMNNVNIVKLTDIININEDFVEKVKEGKYVAWDSELSSAINLIKEDIDSYNLVNEFQNADSMCEENTSFSFSYFTKDSLGISIGVAHALGDHAEFEIKYQDLKENIKTENEIWKDLLQ